jgi:sortase A
MARGIALWISRLLFAAGFIILGYCGAAWINSSLRQFRGNSDLDRLLSNKPGRTPQTAPLANGALLGRVEIPKLHLSAVVFQGTDSSILDEGVGHLDGSSLPGQSGNVVLAAHRDTFFRNLKNIRRGDVITVTTPTGVREYSVDSTNVVSPTDMSVAYPTPKPTLTLITCYPFYYVGHAPKRFIVRARAQPSVTKVVDEVVHRQPVSE